MRKKGHINMAALHGTNWIVSVDSHELRPLKPTIQLDLYQRQLKEFLVGGEK